MMASVNLHILTSL